MANDLLTSTSNIANKGALESLVKSNPREPLERRSAGISRFPYPIRDSEPFIPSRNIFIYFLFPSALAGHRQKDLLKSRREPQSRRSAKNSCNPINSKPFSCLPPLTRDTVRPASMITRIWRTKMNGWGIKSEKVPLIGFPRGALKESRGLRKV